MAEGSPAILVVGYGSELRRDDAVGRRVAEEVERLELPGVRVVTITQLVPELAESIAAVDRVVFVDASVEVRQVTVRELTPTPPDGRSHHTSPAGLVGLVGTLDRPCPPAFVVEVPARDLSLGEGLTDETAHAAERAVAEVRALAEITGSD